MNHFICGFIFSFLLAKVNGLELPDYTTFLQDPEVLDGNVFIDDSTDLFADTANTGNNCLSYDDSDNLFSLNDVARVRPRSPCPNPAAPQTPLPPYTDIYNTDDILNKLSGSSSPSPPVIPGTDRDSNILNLENQLNLPSFIPTHKTTTDDDDDICPREFMGDSQIPVCDTGSFNRNAEVLPGAVCFTIYGVRPYVKTDPCQEPQQLWCCAEVRPQHHPLDAPEAPPVQTGIRCLDPEAIGFIEMIRAIDPEFNMYKFMREDPDGKPLEED